jgi:hypothetical protein
MADDPQQKIEAYLNRIRGRLRGLRAEERREILEELRSHLLEKAAVGGMTGRQWMRRWNHLAGPRNWPASTSLMNCWRAPK